MKRGVLVLLAAWWLLWLPLILGQTHRGSALPGVAMVTKVARAAVGLTSSLIRPHGAVPRRG